MTATLVQMDGQDQIIYLEAHHTEGASTWLNARGKKVNFDEENKSAWKLIRVPEQVDEPQE